MGLSASVWVVVFAGLSVLKLCADMIHLSEFICILDH